MADGSKTEKATPKRRRDERKKGHTFMSQDVVAIASLSGAVFCLFIIAGFATAQLGSYLTVCIEGCSTQETASDLVPLWANLAGVTLKIVLPIALTGILAAVTATFFQTRFLVSGELIKPKFSRINPLEGFKRLFSLRSLIEALKGCLKITLFMTIVYLRLKAEFAKSARYMYTDIPAGAAAIFSSGKAMIFTIILAFIAVAAADVLYQWWEYERSLRMSKQEIKEEYKQTEGDPQIKGKIKEAQRRISQRRMIQQVPSADVVIRNPTHFAVALRYDPEKDNAPILLAKGQDELALRIVKVAEENKVAVVEDVPLARALFAQGQLDREIPQELYSQVAEVLVYVFKLENRQLA
ncbi:MAG: flagellar biosynthesis protein FlhB [Firmicutes bacterium]|nr:flagellar biosynthesis protein FlhB [Bacillota bacterium]